MENGDLFRTLKKCLINNQIDEDFQLLVSRLSMKYPFNSNSFENLSEAELLVEKIK